MKISNINTNLSTRKIQSFGYDKKANAELATRLKTYRDTENYNWGATLLQLQEYCNGLEDNVRNYEKQIVNDYSVASKFQDYIDLFLHAKEALCSYVVDTFSDSDFSDKEFLHYKRQLGNKNYPSDDWRKEVCAVIQDWCQKTRDINDSYPSKKRASIFNNKAEIDPKKMAGPIPSSKPASSLDSTPEISEDMQTSSKTQIDKINSKSFLEIFKNTPNTPKGFCDVAGMAKLKEDLNDKIIQYINDPEQAKLDLEEYGKTMPKGILLYGPPGCGKTFITQALSQEVQTPLYMLNISKAGSHYVNMTSKNIKEAFEQVTELSKKLDKPVLLFMDEIDTLAFDRSARAENEDLKQVGTLLQEIDKVKNENVIVIGATNKIKLLDPAIRRRFDEKSLVDIPDIESIQALLKNSLSKYKKGVNLLNQDEQILEIAKLLKGFSNSSICNISKQAALNALKRDRADISFEDYVKAIKETSEEKPKRNDFILEEANSKPLGFSAY